MEGGHFKKFQDQVAAGIVALVVLGPMLKLGYVLTLDMVFGPFQTYVPQARGEFVSSVPLWYFVHLLYTFLPGFVIEKGMLFGLFFAISFLSLRFLPLSLNKTKAPFLVRLVASLLYTANPFVYERLLAGHWAHLCAYALLPLVLHLLFSLEQEYTRVRAVQLGAVLALVSVFSLHLFVMAVLMSVLWYAVVISQVVYKKKYNELPLKLWGAGVAFVTTLVATSYWTWPALMRAHPVEKLFDAAHWQAFAAVPHEHIPTILNLVLMGGYWGEAYPWASYFRWPQENIFFLISSVAVACLSLVGVYTLWKQQKTRAVFVCVVAVLALVFATGVSDTPFAGLNYFLYAHVPFWSGFRDSQKFIALYALCVSLCAGVGSGVVLEWARRLGSAWRYIVAVVFLVPLLFGVYVWFGFSSQLPSVWYPQDWFLVRSEIASAPQDKMLVVPWQGYLSLRFVQNHLVANPTSQFFGPQAVVSQNVRVGGVYDENGTASYEELDYAVRHQSPADGRTMAEFLRARGIRYVLYLQDLRGVDPNTYQFLQSSEFTRILSTETLELYTISK